MENRFNLLLNSQTNIDFPSQLRNYILERDEFSKNKEVISFYNRLNNHLKKRILTDQELSIGTKKNKRKALNHLQNFLSFKNMIESTEKEFNAHDFLDYLIRVRKVNSNVLFQNSWKIKFFYFIKSILR